MVIELSGVQFGLKSLRVVSKSNVRAARVRFEITSMISDQNCTTRSSNTTLLTTILRPILKFFVTINIYLSTSGNPIFKETEPEIL